MDPLSISLAVITLIGTTHKVIRFLSNVENAPQEMSECLIEVTSAYALLNQLKNRLEGTDKSASWFDKLSALRVEGGPFDQYTTALEQLQSKLDPARSGVIHRVGKAIAWQFKKKELEGILEKLERFKSSIQFILANSHFELSLSIKQDTSDIKQTTQNFENKKEREDLMKWLNKNTFDYSALQNDKIRDRKDGTGSWFLTSPEFESWKTSENCSLICPGIAGAGKTIIIAKTVHHLRESHLPNTGVAVIYFDYKMAADQKPSKLLASVALQLITTLETLPDCVNDFFKKHKGSAPSWEDYQNLIQALVPVFNDVYLMVDAFDEFFSDTEDREQFLDCIRAIQSQSRLKTMVTSRPGFVLEKDFNHSHSIEIRASDADMEAYLEQRKRSCSTCVKNDKTWPSVRNNIIKAADGMFLLAVLHLESIKSIRFPRDVKLALENLPKGHKALPRAYDEAIKRMDSQNEDDAKLAWEAISWIVYAKRPLSVPEFRHALTIQPGDDDISEDDLLQIEDVVSVCVGLITVHSESETVRLVHYTAQEYFNDDRMSEWSPHALADITKKCIAYLLLPGLLRVFGCFARKREFYWHYFPSGRQGRKHQRGARAYDLADYAALFWGNHAQKVQEEVMDDAMQLLQNNAAVIVSCCLNMDMASIEFCRYKKLGRGEIGVHSAAWFGLQEILQSLIQNGQPVYAQNRTGHAPLDFAVASNEMGIVETLLSYPDVDNGLQARKTNESLSKTLVMAASLGRVRACKLLLDRPDVDFNFHAKVGNLSDLREYGWTPLAAVAEGSQNTEIVELLLQKEGILTDVCTEYRGCTPLGFAMGRGESCSPKIARMLIQHGGIDLNAPVVRDFETPPLVAAVVMEDGAVEISKLILDYGKEVDVNKQEKSGRTALAKAAFYGRDEVVSLLLEYRCDEIDVNLTDNYRISPLMYAAKNDHSRVVNILLQRDDIQVNAEDYDGKTAIWYAAQAKKIRNFRLLLERRDINIDVKNDKGQTLVEFTIESGCIAMQMMLEEYRSAGYHLSQGGPLRRKFPLSPEWVELEEKEMGFRRWEWHQRKQWKTPITRALDITPS